MGSDGDHDFYSTDVSLPSIRVFETDLSVRSVHLVRQSWRKLLPVGFPLAFESLKKRVSSLTLAKSMRDEKQANISDMCHILVFLL